MHVAVTLVALVATATGVATLTRHWPIPAPLVLLLVGAAASFVPGIPQISLSPELVLVGLLPPLLYAAAIRSSVIDFRANRSAIGFLAVGLVVITALVVGLLLSQILGVSLAVGCAIGAVVAPPDAVAATAVARAIGLPRRVVTVLEGESLLNDATALVTLRSATTAMVGAVTVGTVLWDFTFAVVVGIAIGWAVGLTVSWLRRGLDDPLIDTAGSFLVPFVAFLPAEAVHASGVLAVVVAGLLLGHRAQLVQTAASRVSERLTWSTIQFVIEHVVFLLIGLQAQHIFAQVRQSRVPTSTLLWACVASFAAVILTRPVVVAAVRVKLGRHAEQPTSWRESLVVSWAGMRGVVTLAAAFSLPPNTPYREVLVLIALVVTAGTLLLQGLTLPWVSRKVGVLGPDPREDALQLATVLQTSTRAGIVALEEAARPEDSETVEMLRALAWSRVNSVWERLGRPESEVETPSQTFRRLRLAMLRAQRKEALSMRDAGTVEYEVLAEALEAFDAEEAALIRNEGRMTRAREAPLVTPAALAAPCVHLAQAPTIVAPTSTDGCPDCAREGTVPVHLRLCLSCGNVGCCDSSPGQHASHHAAAAGHPVIRSFEPGEHWRWCVVDEVLD